MKIRFTALAAGVCLLASLSFADRPHIYALKDARIVVAPGKVIAKGNVIIRDGVIVAAGANVPIPADAEEIDASGKTVYAGLIDASTSVGIPRPAAAATPAAGGGRGGNQLAALVAATSAPRTVPGGANHPIARIHPETEARNLIVPFDPPAAAAGAAAAGTDAERYRNIGFTTVLVAPDSGIFRGTSAVIDLRDSTPTNGLIIKDEVAQHIALEMRGGFGGGGGGGGYPGSLMGVIASIRQAFMDASRYQTWKKNYAANPAGMKRPDFSSSFEALEPVLTGKRLVIFDTEAAEDILAAERITKEFKLGKVVMGADNNVSEQLDRVKATGHTLILSGQMPAKPVVDDAEAASEIDTRDLRRFVNAPANAKKLYDAKVPFVLSSRGVTTIADFPRNVKRMIDAGLPADAALAKLTTEPAELLGLSAQIGTIEAGKIANLIVTDGDLFGANTHVVRIYVDGIEYLGAPVPAARPGAPAGNRPAADPTGGSR